VNELAAEGIPVAVTRRVLKLSRQPYYRWRANPVAVAERAEAYRANALFDAHRDDPEFGYRFLAEEARAAGEPMAERTAWRICAANKWWSAFGKKRGKNGKVVHRCMTIWSPASSRQKTQTRCGWPTLPSIPLVRESSTCARSRTHSPIASSDTTGGHRPESRRGPPR
jgi:hypothetical protein